MHSLPWDRRPETRQLCLAGGESTAPCRRVAGPWCFSPSPSRLGTSSAAIFTNWHLIFWEEDGKAGVTAHPIPETCYNWPNGHFVLFQ